MRQVLNAFLLYLSLFFIFISVHAATAKPASKDIPLIAAASSIKFALDEIIHQFEMETQLSVNVSYGSSGNLVAQIKHGAPFQLFLSADESYVAQLKKVNLIKGEERIYAIGQLALVAPKNSPLVLDKALLGVKTLLTSGQLSRFAIANPKHAPYGERAKVLLQRLGLWQQVQPKLVLGENVSQAAQFVLTGAVQGGIVALSLASLPQFTNKVNYLVLPMDLYPPLNQSMALLNHSNTTATLFYQYILSSKAQSIFKQYGFAPVESL